MEQPADRTGRGAQRWPTGSTRASGPYLSAHTYTSALGPVSPVPGVSLDSPDGHASYYDSVYQPEDRAPCS